MVFSAKQSNYKNYVYLAWQSTFFLQLLATCINRFKKYFEFLKEAVCLPSLVTQVAFDSFHKYLSSLLRNVQRSLVFVCLHTYDKSKVDAVWLSGLNR